VHQDRSGKPERRYNSGKKKKSIEVFMNYLIDTNCLLSYVTDRNPAQSDVIEKLIIHASQREHTIYIISNVITELVFVLETVYREQKSNISDMIGSLLNNQGIEFHHGYFPELIIQLWPSKIKDYGDAVLAAAACELKMSIFTFDRNFGKELSRLKISHRIL
jgi:predicted nucleic-acid-binding protein